MNFEVRSPVSKKVVGTASRANQESIDKAISLLHDAKKKKLGDFDRKNILSKAYERVLIEQSELAKEITLETGLCLQDTQYEIQRVLKVLQASLKVFETYRLSSFDDFSDGSESIQPQVSYESYGMMLAITPFNHPINQVAHKIVPAIIAGVPVLLKPSPRAPLAALRFARILYESGLPPELLQVLTHDRCAEFVPQLVARPEFDVVSFTGGYDVGKTILRSILDSEYSMRKWIPELGGCSSLIVLNDADIQRSAVVAAQGTFRNSGQRCTAIRRIVVVDEIFDRFLLAFLKEAEEWNGGDPSDLETRVGSVINEDAALTIEDRVKLALADGATLHLGGNRQGSYFPATVLSEVSIDTPLVAKETFGPVASLLRVKNLEEAISFAKKTPYRLAGAVMTQSKSAADLIFNEIKVGQFSVNGPPGYRTEMAPFGGAGWSGNGAKEGVLCASRELLFMRTRYDH